jgi:heme/copper-type cytochrome/quinol oxidase subunit 2
MHFFNIDRRSLIIIFLFCIFIFNIPYCSGDDSSIINEISEDWSTEMIVLFIETPNKFDRTYGTNITDKAVLDEISEIEDALDFQKDDKGEVDDFTFVLSISTLIKELHSSPKNVKTAVYEELGMDDLGLWDPPGSYSIPDNQEDIDRIVDQIPEDTKKLLVIDTNEDGIWDSASVIMGVYQEADQQAIMKEVNNQIDGYYIDTRVEKGDENSEESWWQRIENGKIHCRITNLGFLAPPEDSSPVEGFTLWLPLIVIVILMVLLFLTIFIGDTKASTLSENVSRSNRILLFIAVFLILIVLCISFIFIDTSASPSDKLDQYSEEFNGGQMGFILVRGNPAPASGELKNSGSMKDIEVLDEINDMESQLKHVNDRIDDPKIKINPPFSVVEVMKMIKIPQSVADQIVDAAPDFAKDEVEDTLNTSFWEAIHNAGQWSSNVTAIWYVAFDKAPQDSLINIFYASISTEMRGFLVNDDYSKTLVYINMPAMDATRTEIGVNEVNKVVENYPAGKSTSNVAIAKIRKEDFLNLGNIIKIVLLFIILTIGVLVFTMFIKMRGGNQGQQEIGPIGPYYGGKPPNM